MKFYQQKYYVFLIALLLSFNFSIPGTSQRRDSLKLELQNNISDSTRIAVLELLARSYFPNNLDSLALYADQMMAFSEQKKMAFGKAEALLLYSQKAKVLQQYDASIENGKSALSILGADEHLRLQSQIHKTIGNGYEGKREIQEALEHYKISLSLAKRIKDEALIAGNTNNLALLYYFYLNQVDQAFELLLPLVEKKESEVPLKDRIIAHNHLAAIYQRTGGLDKAIDNYKKSLSLLQDTNDFRTHIAILNNASSLYRIMLKFSESRELLVEALRISEENNYNAYRYKILQNIGYTYYREGDIETSVKYFRRSYALIKKTNNTFQLVTVSCSLGEALYKLDFYDESRQVLDDAVATFPKLEDNRYSADLKAMIFHSRSRLDSATKNYASSLEYYKKYAAWRDSIAVYELREKVAAIEGAFETEKKDKEIKLLTAENDLQKESARRERNVKAGLITGTILLLLLLFVAFNRYLIKKRAVATIKVQKRAIEEKSKENELLIKEIHHRVKNNLQIILSLLNAQTFATGGNKQAYDIIIESQNKVKSMALIHENLYSTDNFIKIPTVNYFRDLIKHIEASYDHTDKPLKIVSNIQDSQINMALAVPLGLIVNELITNSYKYAFENHEGDNEVTINFKKGNSTRTYELQVFDNGSGMPVDFEFTDSNSFGLQMIQGLVRQLEGKIEHRIGDGVGFNIHVRDVEAA
ncbi:MAG: histidine kinase dimerization/phosphoacceptor domain -containing protein [Bacteroidota bacterium]